MGEALRRGGGVRSLAVSTGFCSDLGLVPGLLVHGVFYNEACLRIGVFLFLFLFFFLVFFFFVYSYFLLLLSLFLFLFWV